MINELTTKRCKMCPDPYLSDDICEYCNGTTIVLVPYDPDVEDE